MLRRRAFTTHQSQRRPKLASVSVIGPSHIQKGIPNQDACLTVSKGGLHIAVVSDGVGSCPLSHIGSHRLCKVVEGLLLKFKNVRLKPTHFFDALRLEWLRQIRPLSYREASATCLFAVSDGNYLFVGMLGDGAIGLMRKDGAVEMLMENKSSAFSNITNSMTSRTDVTDWIFQCFSVHDLYGVMLATDGIADDLRLPEEFTKEILKSVSDVSVLQSQRMMREMLVHWPVPKHSDDKTIACMVF